jgi:hypothetical protein
MMPPGEIWCHAAPEFPEAQFPGKAALKLFGKYLDESKSRVLGGAKVAIRGFSPRFSAL